MDFEGPEKKLEIHLKDGAPNLLTFDKKVWKQLVKRVNAEVLSGISNTYQRAYLLSESSLFIYPEKLILITCGKTTLVEAIPFFFEHVDHHHLDCLFFERKDENFPENQLTGFNEDIQLIKKMLPGTVFHFGHEKRGAIHLFHSDAECKKGDDSTLEVLMHNPDMELLNIFNNKSELPRQKEMIRQKLNLDSVLPGFQIDDYLFEPAGYSLNAIKNNHYYAMHVTPEKTGPYISFETNYNMTEHQSIADTILNIFRPERASVLAFVPLTKNPQMGRHPGFAALDEKRLKLTCGYSAFFRNVKNVKADGSKNDAI